MENSCCNQQSENSCKACGACQKCEPCDHCRNCRKCGKPIFQSQGWTYYYPWTQSVPYVTTTWGLGSTGIQSTGGIGEVTSGGLTGIV